MLIDQVEGLMNRCEKMAYEMWYPRGKYFSLNIYIDVDLEGDVDDRNSTSGGVLFLGECLVSWLSKKQASSSLYKTEA